MRIAIGADHAGFALKQHLIGTLQRLGHAVDDRGTHSDAAIDYPPICADVARQVTEGAKALDQLAGEFHRVDSLHSRAQQDCDQFAVARPAKAVAACPELRPHIRAIRERGIGDDADGQAFIDAEGRARCARILCAAPSERDPRGVVHRSGQASGGGHGGALDARVEHPFKDSAYERFAGVEAEFSDNAAHA